VYVLVFRLAEYPENLLDSLCVVDAHHIRNLSLILNFSQKRGFLSLLWVPTPAWCTQLCMAPLHSVPFLLAAVLQSWISPQKPQPVVRCRSYRSSFENSIQCLLTVGSSSLCDRSHESLQFGLMPTILSSGLYADRVGSFQADFYQLLVQLYILSVQYSVVKAFNK